MKKITRQAIRTMTFLALTLSLVLALLVPCGYLIMAYGHKSAVLETEAEAAAGFISELISSNPEYWQYAQPRLEDFLIHRPYDNHEELRRIVGLNNAVLAQNAEIVLPPVIMRSRPLYDSGRIVARVEISRSLRPVLLRTLGFALFGLAFGIGSFYLLKAYPLRALDEALQALQESEATFRAMSSTAADAIIVIDNTGRIAYWNQAAHDMFGFSEEEARGGKLHELIASPEFLHSFQQGFDRFTRTGQGPAIGATLAFTARRKNGTLFPIEVSTSAIRRNGAWHALGIVRDITARKEAEEKLRQSEQFIRTMLDTVDEGFLVIDRQYRIVTANKAYIAQVGAAGDDQIVGRHCYEISHRYSRPCYEEGEDCATRLAFETGKPHSAIHLHKDAHGNSLHVETRAFPNKDASGAVTSVIETINDITERHLLEEERLKSQKLESIGTLAGGIAHDFNNLLQGIFGYISLAILSIDEKEKALEMLLEAEKALDQSVNLTAQLLTFSKGGKPIKKLTDLGPVIENSVRFPLSGSRSDFQLTLPEDLWQAEVDAGQLRQVLQNIVLNADQAMPAGGTVMVSAANISEDDAALHPGLVKRNHIMIAIQDSGAGIAEQDLNRIFDPYFTTKETGSGLGLATSYSIVRNHGGMIDVRTTSGAGSTFLVYLPAAAGKAGKADRASVPASSPQRPVKVLVMDDEATVRHLSSELLRALGHGVEVARHGQEALEKYREATAAGIPFDLVILDLTVRGGMGGAKTVKRLREMDPAVKAIVSSGYSDDAALADQMKHGFQACLKKPYGINELRAVVNSLSA